MTSAFLRTPIVPSLLALAGLLGTGCELIVHFDRNRIVDDAGTDAPTDGGGVDAPTDGGGCTGDTRIGMPCDLAGSCEAGEFA